MLDYRMIHAINLGNNGESEIKPEDLQTQGISNVWLELVDPTENELQTVSQTTQLPVNFLRLPKADGYINLRLEEGYSIINFMVMQDVVSTKKVHPVVLAFSKNFLVTVAQNEIQPIFNNVKERMSKPKIDPPSQVAYYILDEIVASHYVHIEKLENLTATIEEEVVEKTSQDTLKRIFKLKTNMISFNKILWYERGLIFNLHKCGDSCMVAKARNLFDTYREILSDAINVHLSAISNKINLSIKGLTIVIFYLTIVTTITSFPNTVATFFGIAQFGNTNIAIISLALMLSIVLPLIWLWKKNWLTSKRLDYS
jgi:magnesium transporter